MLNYSIIPFQIHWIFYMTLGPQFLNFSWPASHFHNQTIMFTNYDAGYLAHTYLNYVTNEK